MFSRYKKQKGEGERSDNLKSKELTNLKQAYESINASLTLS